MTFSSRGITLTLWLVIVYPAWTKCARVSMITSPHRLLFIKQTNEMLFAFLLAFFPISSWTQCSRPYVPQRMIVDFPDLDEMQRLSLKLFPVGTMAVFRCHEDYYDFQPAPETITCQDDGTWWPKYVPNFCANELKNTISVAQLPGMAMHTLPLSYCLFGRYKSLEIDLGGIYRINHFAIKTNMDVSRVLIQLVRKEEGIAIFEEGLIIGKLEAGKEKLVDCSLPAVSHIVIGSGLPLCSFRAAVLNRDNPSKCLPALAGSPEAGRATEISPGTMKYSCDFEPEEQGEATCDDEGLWSPEIECSPIIRIKQICEEHSVTNTYGEFKCNDDQEQSNKPGSCFCDSKRGFMRHPNESCVLWKDCPEEQNGCADFERLVMYKESESTCANTKFKTIHPLYGARCQCKEGLVRILSTGKCIESELCPEFDKKDTNKEYEEFDIACNGKKVYYNYGYANFGFCEAGLFRTREGDCVKKVDCPRENSWGLGWLTKLIGIN